MKQDIFEMYKELNLGNCVTCKECRLANINRPLYEPVSIWTIGENFSNSKDKILFIGKTARGGDESIGTFIDNSFYDATEFGTNSLALDGYSSPYYSYTNEIIKRYFGTFEEGKKNIAFTNLVKCNNGTTKDSTIWTTKILCLDKMKVVWKELEILKPQRIIFYSHTDYDYFIENYFNANAYRFIDITNKAHCISIGNKYSFWWHRDFYNENGNKVLSFLRLSHPERLLKEDYVNNVVRWLKQTKS